VTPTPQGQLDVELVARARAGDERSLELFVQRMRCIPRILQSKNRRLAHGLGQADCDDLAQEVLAAVWDRLDSFQGDSTLEAWAYSFCVRKLMNALKKLSRRAALVEDAAPVTAAASGPAQEPPEETPDFGQVYSSLARLDPDESRAIEFKHFESLTFEEIAQRLRVSPNTVKTRYYRGIDRLRAWLGAEFGGEED
jgi:RNA polymerase sigma-70 factor (ECF subfamily)